MDSSAAFRYAFFANASLLCEEQAWVARLAGDRAAAHAAEAVADRLWSRAEAARASRTRGVA
ncbi:MAG: hypothetical protein EPO40_06150 [Myxococcaceae bacterium]|nr:MAG: hypothetical protein EPO40_06150 [Myxococcaceae bacterium]